MIGLIQRVSSASLEIENEIFSRIDRGILAFIGVQKGDTEKQAERLAERILSYRIFPDHTGRMNLDLVKIKGELLLVPQFTLAANTRKGTRPSFSAAASPDEGMRLFTHFVDYTKQLHQAVETGVFGADMQVSLTNDGPVTFWLES